MSTDSTIQDADVSAYVDGWRERAASRRRHEMEHRARVAGKLASVAEHLVREFGVRRVLLFGSYSRGEARPGSDVDLLVEGLDPSRLIEASVAADRLLGGAHADIVPAQIARPEVRARAEAEGVVLYG